MSLAKEARPTVLAECRNFHGKVCEDLKDAGLLRYTSQLAAIMGEADSLLSPEEAVARLTAANDGLEIEQANEIFRQLLEHELIWLKEYRTIERGIPSFFQYFKVRQERR